MNTMERSKKEQMKEQIDKMESNEHAQILNIVKKYTDNFTKTQSGFLVSTEHLTNECLDEIERYIHFSMDQRKRMDEDNKMRKNYERMIH
jgi:hypothetical protein